MRASGILLPVSSLPSKYGIGCFSEEAYEFVDQLAKAGQKYWQILLSDLLDMGIHHTSLFHLCGKSVFY
mgnify:CR=1 FL=1